MTDVIGVDTETDDGPPFAVTLFNPDIKNVSAFIEVDGSNVTQRFLDHLNRTLKRGDYTLYAHNLRFDMVSFFWPMNWQLLQNDGAFDFTYQNWTIRGIYSPGVVFAELSREGLLVRLVDTGSWFMGTLDRMASIVCPHLPKLDKPKDLGHRRYTKRDADLVAYAMRDAEIAYHGGVAIQEMHKNLDIPQTFSVAGMAGTVFKHHYINEAEPIYNAQERIFPGAFESYMGGKNNVDVKALGMFHQGIDAWDLSSAYPHAMTELPAFSDPHLFRPNKLFNPKGEYFPEHGVYQVSGYAEPCKWPALLRHPTETDRRKVLTPIRRDFEDKWVTGYELNEAVRLREVRLTKVRGHYYDSDHDPVTEPAMARYVKDFYRLKQEANAPGQEIQRLMYKLLLNSLYGKFIQLNPHTNNDTGEELWKAGPLFHPLAASLITGHTRSVMHRLEHETKAIHTATDGIFCRSKDSPKNGFPWSPQDGLGAIESEGENLTLALLRNKLYIAYSQKPDDGAPSKYGEGLFIKKTARHGFQGSTDDLERMAWTDERSYTVNKPYQLRDALNRGKVPNKFEVRQRTLREVPPLERRPKPLQQKRSSKQCQQRKKPQPQRQASRKA